MKRLFMRWVACLLSLMIMLHSTFLSVSASSEPDWEALGYYPVSVTDHNGTYILNPGDEGYPYVDYDVSTLSLGATLGLGQIAGLIAAGAGVVFASQYLDDLGVHLNNALNTAASAVENGRAAYMSWLANAVNGDIALMSAPPWIAKTILDVMYGLVTSTAPLLGSPFGSFSLPGAGDFVSSGTTFHGGLIANSSGDVGNYSTFTPSADCYVYRTYNNYYTDNGSYYWMSQTYHFFSVDNKAFHVSYKSPYSSSVSNLAINNSYVGSDGKVYYYGSVTAQSWSSHISYSTTISLMNHYLDKYYIPGATHANEFSALDVCGSLYGTVPYSPSIGAVPKGDEVAPDVLIGGLPDVWVGQGLGADVVTMPDIALDGSDLINVGDQTALDTSIGTTMDKLATGELTWDDYWLDISGSGPLVDVGEGEGEDVGPPLQLPDWFKDWCKDITGTELDRNSEIDSLLPDLDEGMGQIDDFSASIGDQLKTEFDALHIENFALSTSVLFAIGWIAAWVTKFFNASGEAQVVVLLPMFIGLALLFIGRGSVAMSRVHSSHQHDTRKAAVSGKKGGGTP